MFSGVYSNFNSFIADEYKRGLVQTLLFRIFSIIFSIVSNFELFHVEVMKLKDILSRNEYPKSFSDRHIKQFLDKLHAPKD